MADYPTIAKAQVEAGMPPYLSTQLQRGQVLKKTIVYKAGTTATPANSAIVDIPLPPGVVIDISSIAMTHDGIGAGGLTLALRVQDKQGNMVSEGEALPLAMFTTTSTAGEIIRFSSSSPFGSLLIWDPAYYLVTQENYVYGRPATYEILKEKCDFVLIVKNTAAIAANKQFVIVMDLIIP